MKLFHLTLNHDIEVLKGQKPPHTLEGENKTISRISTADSIESCFKATHWSYKYFNKWDNNSFKCDEDRFITVFEIDSDAINKDNLLGPQYVKENYGVDDAMDTNEYWIINQDVTPINKYKILPTYLREGYAIIKSLGDDCNSCTIKDCEDCINESPRILLVEYNKL